MNILTYPQKAGEKTPKWRRSVLFTDDAEIFIPLAYTGKDEDDVFLRVGLDNATCVEHEGNLYVSLEWAEKEYPAEDGLYNLIKARVEEKISSR